MDLPSTIMNEAGSGGLEKMGGQFGLDRSAVEKVMAQVVPALGQGIKKGSGSGDGLGSLIVLCKMGITKNI